MTGAFEFYVGRTVVYSSSKMFPRQINHTHEDQNNINKSGSWRSFTRRSYFSRDTREFNDSDSNGLNNRQRQKLSKVWIYVGIAIVYLLIIGIVVIVLVLAPRYPSYYGYPPTNVQSQDIIPLEIDSNVQNSVADFQAPLGKPFLPSPRDPNILYNMDPRSNLETDETGGSTKQQDESNSSRLRVNNKFLDSFFKQ